MDYEMKNREAFEKWFDVQQIEIRRKNDCHKAWQAATAILIARLETPKATREVANAIKQGSGFPIGKEAAQLAVEKIIEILKGEKI